MQQYACSDQGAPLTLTGVSFIPGSSTWGKAQGARVPVGVAPVPPVVAVAEAAGAVPDALVDEVEQPVPRLCVGRRRIQRVQGRIHCRKPAVLREVVADGRQLPGIRLLGVYREDGATAYGGDMSLGTVFRLLAPPRFTSFNRLADGDLQIDIRGFPNMMHRLEASTDLVTWVALTNRSATDGSLSFVDPEARTQERRFYRAAWVQ